MQSRCGVKTKGKGRGFSALSDDDLLNDANSICIYLQEIDPCGKGGDINGLIRVELPFCS